MNDFGVNFNLHENHIQLNWKNDLSNKLVELSMKDKPHFKYPNTKSNTPLIIIMLSLWMKNQNIQNIKT